MGGVDPCGRPAWLCVRLLLYISCNDADGWQRGTPTRVPAPHPHLPRPYGMGACRAMLIQLSLRETCSSLLTQPGGQAAAGG